MYGMPQMPNQLLQYAKCNVCGTQEGLQRCGRCRSVYYCGVDHQRRDWDGHQKACVPYQPPPMMHPQQMMQQFMQQPNAYGYPQPQPQSGMHDPSQMGMGDPSQVLQYQEEEQYEPTPNAQRSNVEEHIPIQQSTHNHAHQNHAHQNMALDVKQFEDEPAEPDQTRYQQEPAGYPQEAAGNEQATIGQTRQLSPNKVTRKTPPKKHKTIKKKQELEIAPDIASVAPIDEPTLGGEDEYETSIWDNASMPPPPPPAPPSEPEAEKEPEEEDVETTTWETSLGILVLRGDKGYYGDGPLNDFDWRDANKWCLDVQTKHHAPLKKKGRRRGKNIQPYTEVWGKWKWNEAAFGPNNEGRFKLRLVDDQFKGTWGWGNRTRGGGEWTGQRAMTEKELQAETAKVADAEQEEIDVQLCHAAVGGDDQNVHALLDKGANPNNVIVESCTPAVHAVVMDHPKVIRALLSYPSTFVDLDKPDDKGFTALHVAAEHAHVQCAKEILARADAEVYSEELLEMVPSEHSLADFSDFFKVLAAYSLPVNMDIQDEKGRTALDITFSITERDGIFQEKRRQIAQIILAKKKVLKGCCDMFDHEGPAAPEEEAAAELNVPQAQTNEEEEPALNNEEEEPALAVDSVVSQGDGGYEAEEPVLGELEDEPSEPQLDNGQEEEPRLDAAEGYDKHPRIVAGGGEEQLYGQAGLEVE